MFALDGIKHFEKLKQFKGFKYFHSTNQEEPPELNPPFTNTNCHFLLFGCSGSRKSSFLKDYLYQTESHFIVFGRDANEFHDNRYVELLQLRKVKIESFVSKNDSFRQCRCT